MFEYVDAMSGFSVKDLDRAAEFYGETLGLKVDKSPMGLTIHLKGDATLFVYQKDNHEPATFTILNFVVDDIDKAVEDLKAKGIEFEHYPDMNGDEDIARGSKMGQGPDIAWFTDPDGNVLSVLHNEE